MGIKLVLNFIDHRYEVTYLITYIFFFKLRKNTSFVADKYAQTIACQFVIHLNEIGAIYISTKIARPPLFTEIAGHNALSIHYFELVRCDEIIIVLS